MSSFSQIRNSPVGKAVGESLPFILPVAMLAAGKALHEFLPGKVFVGVLAVVGLFLYFSVAREPTPKAVEDDLSSKSRRAQSIAQELEREAASEQAARDRKKSAADKKKKKGQQQQGNKGAAGASAGASGGSASVEDEDEDEMLLRLAQRRAQGKR